MLDTFLTSIPWPCKYAIILSIHSTLFRSPLLNSSTSASRSASASNSKHASSCLLVIQYWGLLSGINCWNFLASQSPALNSIWRTWTKYSRTSPFRRHFVFQTFRRSLRPSLHSDLAHTSIRRLKASGHGSKSKHWPLWINICLILSGIHRLSAQNAELFKSLNFITLEDLTYHVEHAYPDATQERLKVVMLWNFIAFFVSIIFSSYATQQTSLISCPYVRVCSYFRLVRRYIW